MTPDKRRPEHCPACLLAGAHGGYCAPLRCYCLHPACPAYARDTNTGPRLAARRRAEARKAKRDTRDTRPETTPQGGYPQRQIWRRPPYIVAGTPPP